ncbi:MAG TPA: autotransporter-associated beta strand repeat-containing protein, partial [Candidatus Methylacidiphilales bacterium]|nr:autotransporter-associated beta strand repeat-containing protein [Candidatus Methylacidiphilales bacterium]
NVTAPTTLYALKIDGGAIVGGGTLTLGDGTHTAGLIINGSAAGTPTLVTAPINFAAGSEGAVYVGGNGTSDYAEILGPVSGTNGLTKNGNGTLILEHATYTGTTTINDGTLELAYSGTGTPGFSSTSVVNLAGTLLYQGNGVPTASATINLISDATIGSATNASDINVAGTINGNGHALTVTGYPIELSGTQNNVSQYNITNGFLQVAGMFGSATAPINVTATMAQTVLDLENGATVLDPVVLNEGNVGAVGSGTLSGSLTVGTEFGYVNAGTGTLTLSGAIQGNNPLYFESAAGGTALVTGTSNTYTGTVELIEGNLAVTGNLSTANKVWVQGFNGGAAAVLSGTGTVGLINLAQYGKLAPGMIGGTGTLTASSLVWNTDNTPQLEFQLSTTSSASSLLNLGTGSLTLNGSSFAFDFQDSGGTGQDYTLITFGAGETNAQISEFIADDLAAGVSGTFALVTNGTTESLMFDTAAPVPEPATNALLLAGILGLLALNRARRRLKSIPILNLLFL